LSPGARLQLIFATFLGFALGVGITLAWTDAGSIARMRAAFAVCAEESPDA
jgi:hypothetical protein